MNNDLRNLFGAVKLLHNLSTHREVKSDIRDLRLMIKNKTKVDPLDPQGRTFWGRKRPFFMEGSMYYSKAYLFNKDVYWIDNWLEAKRNADSNLLKDKNIYFRDGNNFYKKDEYFKAKDGKIYSREEYRERDGIAYSLKQSREVCLVYKEKDQFSYQYDVKKYVITCNEGEEFAEFSGRFRLIPVNYPSFYLRDSEYGIRYLDREFFSTMFKVGNKRIRNEVPSMLKEDIAQLEFAPTESHKQVLRDILKDFKEYPNIEQFVNETLEYIRKGCEFEVKMYEDWRYRKQVKKKIIHNLCDNWKYGGLQAIKVLKFLSTIEED